MTCVLILPAKWKKQQISTHTSRISAKLGHAIVFQQSWDMLVAHPHNPQLAKPCQFFSKKEGLLFL
jgi:hypothetical protein